MDTEIERNIGTVVADVLPRIPHGVKAYCSDGDCTVRITGVANADDPVGCLFLVVTDDLLDYDTEPLNCKPYLRPMTSMTDDERAEWMEVFSQPIARLDQCDDAFGEEHAPEFFGESHIVSVEWLDERHFDYRNLIGAGLALEATEGVYD